MLIQWVFGSAVDDLKEDEDLSSLNRNGYMSLFMCFVFLHVSTALSIRAQRSVDVIRSLKKFADSSAVVCNDMFFLREHKGDPRDRF